ncbi:MAG: hypothetical protein E6H74_02565 [Betaproteobacteria bacterium]|nr:MAG: hypothetical protein E6H74_02565 [Betaproteobacteria bacterium]
MRAIDFCCWPGSGKVLTETNSKPKSGMTEIPVSVRQKGGSNLKNTSAFVCMLAALAAVSPSDAAKPTSCAATFAGRIAYTTGVIHICDGATGADVNTGVSGVNPKFSPDSSLIVYPVRRLRSATAAYGRSISTVPD